MEKGHIASFTTSLLGGANDQPLKAVETTFEPPVAKRRLTVTLDELQAYGNNPRQSVNPKYADIKESIRSVGLNQPPRITARPGESHYIIYDGGNTRLSILNELWAETQDVKFFQFECDFVPYTSELDLLAGHMIENEERGGMLFIEKALALSALREEFAQIDGVSASDISQRQLVDRTSQLGWSVSLGLVPSMTYAADRLLNYLPSSFWEASLGRPAVQQIKKLHDAAIKLWGIRGNGLGDIESIFSEALTQADSPEFKFADLLEDLCVIIDRELVAQGVPRPAHGMIEHELVNYMNGVEPVQYTQNPEVITSRQSAGSSGESTQTADSNNNTNQSPKTETNGSLGLTGVATEVAPTTNPGGVDSSIQTYEEPEPQQLIGGVLQRLFQCGLGEIAGAFGWTDRYPYFMQAPSRPALVLETYPQTNQPTNNFLLIGAFYSELDCLFGGVQESWQFQHHKDYLQTVIDTTCAGRWDIYGQQQYALKQAAINPQLFSDTKIHDLPGALAALTNLKILLNDLYLKEAKR